MSGRKKIIYGYRYNPDSYQTELVVRTQDSNHQVGCNHLQEENKILREKIQLLTDELKKFQKLYNHKLERELEKEIAFLKEENRKLKEKIENLENDLLQVRKPSIMLETFNQKSLLEYSPLTSESEKETTRKLYETKKFQSYKSINDEIKRTKLKKLPDKESVKEKWNIYKQIHLDTIRESGQSLLMSQN